MKGENTQTIEVDGFEVRYQRTGSGPALVLVHGLLGYSFSWRFAMSILSRNREVFALDMLGSGFSACDACLDCSLPASAKRLSRFLDAVGISRCDLLGSSYGGTTALMLATQEPARFRTLTLVSPANPWSKIGRKRLAVLRDPVAVWAFPFLARIFRPPLLRFFVRRMYGDPAAVTPETVKGYSLPVARPGVLEHAVKIAHVWRTSMSQLQQALAAPVEIPTLILWGGKDRMVDPASAEKLKQHFHNAKVETLPKAGHLPYEEYPEQFCQIVLDFLARHSPAQGLDGK